MKTPTKRIPLPRRRIQRMPTPENFSLDKLQRKPVMWQYPYNAMEARYIEEMTGLTLSEIEEIPDLRTRLQLMNTSMFPSTEIEDDINEIEAELAGDMGEDGEW